MRRTFLIILLAVCSTLGAFATATYSDASRRVLKNIDINGMTARQLRLLRNEIYARHGYTFRSTDLTEYFSQFDWYTPTSSDVSGSLNIFEQKNTIFLRNAEQKLRSTDASLNADLYDTELPLTYSFTSTTKLTDSYLRGVTKLQMRLIRNEIYARHGYIFHSADLRSYFSRFSWYKPTSSDVSQSLNAIETYNIQFLKKAEHQLD